jgi:hypothetical protein
VKWLAAGWGPINYRNHGRPGSLQAGANSSFPRQRESAKMAGGFKVIGCFS